jgi:hypothetical protein
MRGHKLALNNCWNSSNPHREREHLRGCDPELDKPCLLVTGQDSRYCKEQKNYNYSIFEYLCFRVKEK